MSKELITDNMKDKIGRKCCNCGCEEDIEYHHIVPLALGGFHIITNIIAICHKCHLLAHGRDNKNRGNFSAAVKAGIERARAEGKQIGRKKGSIYETKKAKATKEIIIKHSKDFDGNLSDIECMKLAGVTKKTYYIYKKQLREKKGLI